MRRRGPLFMWLKYLVIILVIAAPPTISAQTKKDRDRAKKLTEQADKAFQQKNYSEAIETYAQAIALVPNNPVGHYWKGASHYYLWRDGEDALSRFETERKEEKDP